MAANNEGMFHVLLYYNQALRISQAQVCFYTNVLFWNGWRHGEDVVMTYTADLICNPDIDFDATFDQYIKEWNEQGGAQWTQEINEYWQSR